MADDAFSVDWMQGWSELQRKIWNEWIAMAGEHLQPNRGFSGMPGVPGMESATQWPMQWLQQAMAAAGSGMGGGTMPWAMPWLQQGMGNPLDDWARAFGVYTPEAKPERVMMGNMMDAANGFVRLSKEIFAALQKMGEGVQDGGEWTQALDRSIQQAKALFSGKDASKVAVDPMAAWSQPLQAWAKMVQDNPLFSSSMLQSMLGGNQPSGLSQGMGGMGGMGGMDEWFQKLAGMPGLGPNREKQERMQHAMRDLMVYQKAFQQFQTLTNQVNVKALDLLHKKLLERGATNTPVESLRDLYVLWVDCSEEVNGELMRGALFQQANSEMVNALMRVQRNAQTAMDEMLGALNLPTRKELNSSHRQVHELKHRVRALEEEIKLLRTQDHTAELRSIRDDLDRLDGRNLRQELADMKSLLEAVRPASSGLAGKKAAVVSRPRAAARAKSVAEPVLTAASKGE